ncbi:hypothetical protein GE061_009763 [Apolygus lucorum]|uniref:Uncharacterized protein n=1 Tax=Apolygus lucorum TaxID=248454 RepID=A0A8S9Y589_APOLU|nr:hypothetical protein GE061_009763 [Apolygus lucorum]
MLICSSIYGLTRRSLWSKKFAMTAMVLYCTSGGFGLAREITNNNENVADADNFFFGLANLIGIDLFMVDICFICDINPRICWLTIIPPASGLFMRCFMKKTSNRLSDITHILSVGALFVFAIWEDKPILIFSGIAFLFAVLNGLDTTYDYDDVTAYNAIAVFCSTLYLNGKDFKDIGF